MIEKKSNIFQIPLAPFSKKPRITRAFVEASMQAQLQALEEVFSSGFIQEAEYHRRKNAILNPSFIAPIAENFAALSIGDRNEDRADVLSILLPFSFLYFLHSVLPLDLTQLLYRH